LQPTYHPSVSLSPATALNITLMHLDADDTQWFLAMRGCGLWASTIHAGLSTLKACTRDVKHSFAENDLLNADKSEVMMIGTPAQLGAASTVNTVAVTDANLTLWSKLKSLGVILDIGCCLMPTSQRYARRATITSGHFGTSGDYYHSTWRRRWPVPSSAQGWITVIQSCTEHRLRPSRSSSESKICWLESCYNSGEFHMLVHCSGRSIPCRSPKESSLKSQL